MKCCPQCFKDRIARELVGNLASSVPGICDLCGVERDRLLTIARESELSEQFFDLLSVFSPASGEMNSYDSLFDAFGDTWNVFEGIAHTSFDELIECMFSDDERIKGLLTGAVRLDPSPDPNDAYLLSFFGEKDWHDFSSEIKHIHRYHAEIHERGILKRILYSLEKKIDSEGPYWYRARIWNDVKDDLEITALKEPPPEKSSEGRMSPRGVPCLYISNDVEGDMAEIRASRYDEVAVMTMKPLRDLRILDLSRVDEISPFDENVDCRELASNLKSLRQIKDALVKPMRATDDCIEYIPTQYIADFARSIGFDGIGYDSVLHERGGRPSYNIASFTGFDGAFECEEIAVYRVVGSRFEVERVF